ncbi:oligosaccharide flippase family protein [Schleiferiaceae bacterium]|nr:oligosaccharide flippase family protein [Schleiferiaceae bacterium]
MIGKNLFANLLSNVWGTISVFIFVPLYIELLGIEAYGLVGFYAVLTGFLTLADLGFSATLKRELALASVQEEASQLMRKITRTYELLYTLISIFLSVIVWFVSPLIEQHWLTASNIHAQEVIRALRLMGICIAFQLPAGLFIGGLMGLQRQLLANSLNMGVGILRGCGAVIILTYVNSSVVAFFVWQLIANIAYLFFARSSLWRIITFGEINSKPKFSWDTLRSTGRFALGMAGISLIGVILTQVDKLVVTKLATLEEFSYYSLAGSIASLPIILVGALGSAVFPRFTEIVAVSSQSDMNKIYRTTSEGVGIILIPAGLLMLFFCGELIYVWTGSNYIADKVEVAAALLIAGQLLQSVTVIPYNLALAHGSVKFSQKLGFFSVLFVTPLLIALTVKYDIVGTAISWFILNIVTAPINLYFLHRQKLSNSKMLHDCIRGIIRPLIITLPALLLFKSFLPDTNSRLQLVVELGLIWFVVFALSIASFPNVLSIIKRGYNNLNL